MTVLSVARPWTYWMALPVLLLVIVSLLGVFVNYLRKVVAPKYPRD